MPFLHLFGGDGSMEDFTFVDALTGNTITLASDTGDATIGMRAVVHVPMGNTVFFPGCAVLNYGMALTEVVYKTLSDLGVVNSISVLCCGKILSYEPDGVRLREEYENELRETVARMGIDRFVCACPNCVKALREALSIDPRTKNVRIDVLPQVLADAGYQLDAKTCAALVKGDPDASVLFAIHDSCPDREYGDFARGLRALVPEEMRVDPEHSWKKSVCCGSLPRAMGRIEQANKCADLNGREAIEAGADAILTACMSCDFQLNMAQPHIQCVHALEMLYNWRIDWTQAAQHMKLRFLFHDALESLEAVESESGREFVGLKDVAISDVDVKDMG